MTVRQRRFLALGIVGLAASIQMGCSSSEDETKPPPPPPGVSSRSIKDATTAGSGAPSASKQETQSSGAQ